MGRQAIGRQLRRVGLAGPLALLLAIAAGAAPALACAGLIGPGGTVKLARTTTLAGYADGVEHYVTSFEYAGGGARFGSIIPLPAVPTKVEKGGDWTLKRLVQETQPQPQAAELAQSARAADGVEEVLKARVDALDITVLRGGGRAVGEWARRHGFGLSPDAPEVLDFYAARSRVFMAASFDAPAAAARGQRLGDGTPVHLTIPTRNPWVPLRILGLGLQPAEQVQADVYLLTEREPAMLPRPSPGAGLELAVSREASPGLLRDLHADEGMGWVRESGMWLSHLRVDSPASRLSYDLAVDASGTGEPSAVAAGLTRPAAQLPPPAGAAGLPGELWPWTLVLLGAAAAALGARALRRSR
jgi:hypothetical protein